MPKTVVVYEDSDLCALVVDQLRARGYAAESSMCKWLVADDDGTRRLVVTVPELTAPVAPPAPPPPPPLIVPPTVVLQEFRGAPPPFDPRGVVAPAISPPDAPPVQPEPGEFVGHLDPEAVAAQEAEVAERQAHPYAKRRGFPAPNPRVVAPNINADFRGTKPIRNFLNQIVDAHGEVLLDEHGQPRT